MLHHKFALSNRKQSCVDRHQTDHPFFSILQLDPNTDEIMLTYLDFKKSLIRPTHGLF